MSFVMVGAGRWRVSSYRWFLSFLSSPYSYRSSSYPTTHPEPVGCFVHSYGTQSWVGLTRRSIIHSHTPAPLRLSSQISSNESRAWREIPRLQYAQSPLFAFRVKGNGAPISPFPSPGTQLLFLPGSHVPCLGFPPQTPPFRGPPPVRKGEFILILRGKTHRRGQLRVIHPPSHSRTPVKTRGPIANKSTFFP